MIASCGKKVESLLCSSFRPVRSRIRTRPRLCAKLLYIQCCPIVETSTPPPLSFPESTKYVLVRSLSIPSFRDSISCNFSSSNYNIRFIPNCGRWVCSSVPAKSYKFSGWQQKLHSEATTNMIRNPCLGKLRNALLIVSLFRHGVDNVEHNVE